MRHVPTILAILFAAAALSFPLSDTDVWWHLAAGRSIAEGAGIPRSDPFCASSFGTPWIDLHWGFQSLVWAAHRAGGDAALVALRIVLATAAVLLALGGRCGWGTLAVATLGLQATRVFLDLRPLLVSLVALAALWRLLERKPTAGVMAGAMGLQVVLANTQGLFLLGPLFAAAAAAGAALEGRRADASRQGLLAVLLVAASLANPWGWRAFDLAGTVAGRIVPTASNLFSREIPENLPLHLWVLESPARILLPAWIAVLAFAFHRRGDGAPGRILLLAGTGVLACMAVRNLPILGLAVLLSIAPRALRRPASAAALLAAPALIALFGFLDLRELRWNDPSTRIAPFRLPDSVAISVLRSEPGPVFHEIRAGGWLAWSLPDRRACWCDTRLVLHDAAFVADYLEVLRDPVRFDAWSLRRGFRFALLPVAEMPDARPLVARLLASPDWDLVDCDGAWALFARAGSRLSPVRWREPRGRERVAARVHARFGDNPRLERYAEAGLDALFADAAGRMP